MTVRLFFISIVIKTFWIYQIGAQAPVAYIQRRPSARLFQCPSNLTLCRCDAEDWRILCYVKNREFGHLNAQQVEQEVISIKAKNRKNGTYGTTELQKFIYLGSSSLEIFDLILLDGFYIQEIVISTHSHLKKIVGDLGHVNIFSNVKSVSIDDNRNLDDDGLGDTLKAFSTSTKLTKLNLSGNSLRGNDGSNFLPGLSSLVFLEELNLAGNEITRIFTEHFQSLSRLKKLNLWSNKIVSIKGNIFFVPNNLNELMIDLSDNSIDTISALEITNSSTMTTNFTSNKKSISLKLETNRLSSLPFEIFYKFLQSNVNNTVNVWENPLICGKRTKWLTEGISNGYSRQVKGARCSNLQKAPLFKEIPVGVDFLCPERLQITPCTCESTRKIFIKCADEEIVQENIQNVVQVLRRVNRVPENQLLHISSFKIENTEISELNLTPLFQTKIFVFWITNNTLLKKITSDRAEPGSIQADRLSISSNPKLDDEGLGDILKLFSPEMEFLELSSNSLRGYFKFESNLSASHVQLMEREFFPGLAQLYNIEYLNVFGNKIEHLGVGRFRNNSKLEFLKLGGNQISILQKNVFFFKNSIQTWSDEKFLEVDLNLNNVGVNSFPLNVFGSTLVILDLEQHENLSVPPFFSRFGITGLWVRKTWEFISFGLICQITGTVSPFACPGAQEIHPCSCIEYFAEIVCIGDQVRQQSIEILLKKLKGSNGEKIKPKLVIAKFKIAMTRITELDLSPLNECQILTLFVFGNSKLRKITRQNFTNSSSIVVRELIVEFNLKLADFGIENLLTHFEPEIEILSLAENSITLNKTLNGLSTLKKLKTLSLRANKIFQLSSNFFNGVINCLEHLDLSENKMERIDQDAFGFFPGDAVDQNANPLVINLNFNSITENSFPLNQTGLEKLQRSIQLSLVHNKMTTLTIAPFNSIFTEASEKFQIDLYGNPLDCDWRLNWLEKTSVFNSSSRILVENAECINQPRKFIHNFQKSVTQNFCSEMKNVWPCSCVNSSDSLECVGDEITDESFQEVFLKIKRVDPFCSKTFPGLNKLVIRTTKLARLDLTYFFDVCLFNLTSLVVDSNSNLSRIIGPPLGGLSMKQSIKVQNLEITWNPLTDEGLGSTLEYFSPQMETLNVHGNQVKGNLGTEFLLGLSNLKNLKRIQLNSNQIVQLPGGMFKNNSKLRLISFVGNKISKISENAFSFPTNTDNNETLVIDLSSNSITEYSFDQKMFDDKTNHPVNLILNQNSFTTIPADPFENFLEANPANQLNLEGNNLTCDENMDWIKNRKEKFNRSRILNADCEGDSIFNSKYFNAVVEKVADKGVLAIVLGIVIPAILISTFFAVYQWKKSQEIREEILHLSKSFREGSSNLSPEEIHAAIMSRPFNEELEIPRKKLVFKKTSVLGSGQFGIVYKGIFKSKTGNVTVGLKTVTASADLQTFKSLLTEIKILDHLGSHQNIIQLFGAVTTNLEKSGDVLAVLEFCRNGDLLSYISERRNNFQDAFAKNSTTDESVTDLKNRHKSVLTTAQLLKFAMGVANGLEFLRIKKVIHGDLATRNILLTKKLEAKISDFGLSHQLRNYPVYFKTTECPLPLRWMSIEAIKDMNFSICSDTWSFGVVLYEIFSLGEIPYPGLAVDQQFLPRLLRGYRMEKPKYANQKIYELMLETWKLEPHDRPTSGEIQSRLYKILDQINSGTESLSGVLSTVETFC